jgi:hypothetical protein
LPPQIISQAPLTVTATSAEMGLRRKPKRIGHEGMVAV